MDNRFERIHPDDTDHRSPSQRDRDRIVYTFALQRLAGVTQVASASEGVTFHNRLTHTLEMAQLGRRLAEKLNDETPKSLLSELGGIHPDIVEAACLAHDIGLPPFGHTAEDELDKLLIDAGDPDGFEGNAQSLRTVTTLEPYRPQFLGLNLTRSTINGILKYPSMRCSNGSINEKWGVYATEKGIFDWARLTLKSPLERTPEAELMDISDDIVYGVHDLYDFYRANIIPIDQIVKNREFRERFFYSCESWKSQEDKFGIDKNDVYTKFSEFVDENLHPITEPYCGTNDQLSTMRLITSLLIKRFRDALKIQKKNNNVEIRMREEQKLEITILHNLTRIFVHNNYSLCTQRVGYRKIIRTLFNIYVYSFEKREFGVFPVRFREILIDDGKIRNYTNGYALKPWLRIISDLICSLTDEQALSIYQRLNGYGPGKLLDAIIV